MKVRFHQMQHFCQNEQNGNYHHHTITPEDIRKQTTCPNCGEVYATPEKVVAHIYEELTE